MILSQGGWDTSIMSCPAREPNPANAGIAEPYPAAKRGQAQQQGSVQDA